MAPKLSNEDESDKGNNIGPSGREVRKFPSHNQPSTDICGKENRRDEDVSAENIPTVHKLSPNEPTNGHHCRNTPSHKKHRKRPLLPIHSPETLRDNSFKRRRRQKQELSLENFFQDESQELRFRFGSSYKDFVLPLGVRPSPSAKQRSSRGRKPSNRY